jgi:hypothetical protein
MAKKVDPTKYGGFNPEPPVREKHEQVGPLPTDDPNREAIKPTQPKKRGKGEEKQRPTRAPSRKRT